MSNSRSLRVARQGRAFQSIPAMLLWGCATVLILGLVAFGLNRLNAAQVYLPYTMEAGDALPEASVMCGVSGASYAEETAVPTAPGEYTVYINTPTGSRRVRLTVVDTTPPVIDGAEDISVYVGESVAYRKNIRLSDNAGEEGITLQVDSSKVNTAAEGAYTVIYTATDLAGNTASATASVYVKQKNVNETLLFEGVEKVCGEILKTGMSKEDQLRAVYDYIQTNISYVNHSDKTDWIGEAYNGLFVTGAGDCFTYFAAAKAFLTYLDIPFIELQRAPGLTEETHFWMLVNISDTPGVRTWYHYDATRLRAQYNHSGCLLTDKQAQAYNKVRPYFYTSDRDDLPATSEIIITETPELEAYY